MNSLVNEALDEWSLWREDAMREYLDIYIVEEEEGL